MAFDTAGALQELQRDLKDLGLFFSVDIERPGQPRGEGPSVTLHCSSVKVAIVRATQPTEIHEVHIVIWRQLHTTGAQSQELEAQSVAGQVMDYLYGNFSLNGRTRAVDVGGIYGDVLRADTEVRNVDGIDYFITDITAPLIVDSDTNFVAVGA